jgi:hypothetical protein
MRPMLQGRRRRTAAFKNRRAERLGGSSRGQSSERNGENLVRQKQLSES